MAGPSAAMPESVDGIFVGGGHNSLVAASYLARAGLQVLVLEATSKLGGAMTTDELTLPGFRHNVHAHFVRWQPDNPVWRDLRIDRFGVRTIFPEVQDAIVVEGGRRVLMHYREPARSEAALRGFNAADAEAYRQLFETCSELSRRIIAPLRFAPPLPPEEEADLLARSQLGRRLQEWSRRSALDLVLEWFAGEPARILVGFNVAVRGYQPVLDVPGTGYAAVVSLPAASQAQLIEGGSGEIGRGLGAVLAANGGHMATGARVAAIDVMDGRARGVTLDGGQRLQARRFIASSVPAPITLLDLVGREHLDRSLVDAMEAYRWNADYALFGFHLALSDRPRFEAEAVAPDLPLAYDIALGYEKVTDLLDEVADVRRGEVGPFRVQTTIPTVHDPSQAPAGRHVAFGWKVVPPAFDDAGLLDELVGGYSKYAPNLLGAVLAAGAFSPADIARRLESMPGGDHLHGSFHPDNWGFNRPHPTLSGFRTPLEGLYLCGSSQHPGGGFSGAPGFIAAGVIADDLGIGGWWARPDPRRLLLELD